MNEKEVVTKYLNGIKRLEDYYSKNNKQIDEYISVWNKLKKGNEKEELRFIFNHEPNKMIRYVGLIDYINELLISKAIHDKEKLNKSNNKKSMFLKNYIEMFSGFKENDYINDSDLSNDTKELAKIFFDFKSIEKELYDWLKDTQKKARYKDVSNMGIYI